MMLEQQTINGEHNRALLGKTIEVLVEGFDYDNSCYYGRSEADAPEIDGTVLFVSEQEHDVGEFVTVKIIDATEYDLMGQVVQEETE